MFSFLSQDIKLILAALVWIVACEIIIIAKRD